jgi:transcriptional regulator with XRE-family HTH domain
MENELSMKIVYYKKKLKMTNKILAEKTGLPVGTISRIASGETKEPTLKTLRLIAKAFDCTIDDLQSGGTIEPYYLNQETAELAQEIYDNPNLKILFDASKHLTPEDIRAVIEIAKRIQSTKQ